LFRRKRESVHFPLEIFRRPLLNPAWQECSVQRLRDARSYDRIAETFPGDCCNLFAAGGDYPSVMKTRTWTHWAVGLVATAVISTSLVTAADHGGGANVSSLRERIHAKLVVLGITSEQKEQIRAVLREFQPTVGPLVKTCIQERRALRETIRATPVNEAAIRAQSAKVAAAEADLAVARARIVEKVRPILTAEQLKALHGMEEDAYARIDEGLARLASWIKGK